MFCSKRKNIYFETKIYDSQNFICPVIKYIYISKKLFYKSDNIIKKYIYKVTLRFV